ncbi:FecR family protein [Chitinophaga polysaccharea]|uniref:FecR family protein n=1 Tax=Chitinophaga polysaccharea TaxID=1293035 RepID=UPI0011590CE9|nr:FecR family protein [Chitinophaga polysaccharea]
MQEQRIIYLLEQLRLDTATSSELEELSSFIREAGEDGTFHDALASLMERYPANGEELAAIDPRHELADKVLAISRDLPMESVRSTASRGSYSWARYAAAIIVIVSTGIYFWRNHENTKVKTIVASSQGNITPGRTGAILTLSNGTALLLDTIQNGTLALQGGATARVINGGLVYEANSGEVSYNTISTPKGRQYHVTLPDGTEVWLNAASSIRYPTMFSNQERSVTLAGEAYFEVKKATASFRVNINNNVAVEVLGTSFNINSYSNEGPLKATLLEGAVRVVKDNERVILHPGEQAEVDQGIRVKKDIDVNHVIAWKNGIFYFDGVKLEEAMRQLERWYEIEVVYEKGLPDITFSGKLTRDVPLNDLLAGLEKLGVHFRLEGHRLIIQP